MNTIEAIIYDMDNTLINSRIKLGWDVKNAFARLGTTITLEEAQTTKNWEALATTHGHTLAEFWSSFNKRETWKESIQQGTATIFPETIPILKTLQEKEYRLVLVSRSEEKETMEKVQGFGLQTFFKKPYLVAPKRIRETRSKTKTIGYMNALDQEGIAAELITATQTIPIPTTIFIVGDSEEDVWAGEALRRWTKTHPPYSQTTIITILVDRQGRKQTTRAQYTVQDLKVAYEVIKTYRMPRNT